MSSPSESTHDTMFNGRLHCLQPRDGYRFSLDAVLLAHFIAPKKKAAILDLGAGCGIVSLVLAYRQPEAVITAVEIQAGLADLCRRNVVLNEMAARLQVVEADFRSPEFLATVNAAFDWVVANPPYRKLDSGQRNPLPEQAAARHEINADLSEVINAAARALRNRGRVAVVYPASRFASLLAAMKNRRLEPKRVQIVYSYPGGEGRLVLVEAVKGGGEEMLLMPAFYVYERQGGAYSEEMQRCYAE